MLPVDAASGADAFCARLVQSGVLARRPQRDKAIGARLALRPFPVALPHEGRALVSGQIVLGASKTGTLVITRQSRFLPNLMRGLRSQLDQPGAPGTDGDDNLVWPYGAAYDHLLGLQLADAAVIVDALVASIAAAAGTEPGFLLGDVWIQQCEVARDHALDNAENFVRDLAQRPILGAAQHRLRSFADSSRNRLAVSWHEGSDSSAERKVYAKRHDLVRTEVSLRSRTAVVALLKRTGVVRLGLQGLSGAEVAAALSDVASVAALARQALHRLIVEGMFDARGLGASDALLLALKDMAGAGAVRASAAQPRLFSVHPSLEVARQALAGARQ